MHCKPKEKPNRTHIVQVVHMQDSEAYFLVQLIEPIFDLETSNDEFELKFPELSRAELKGL